MMDAGNHDHRDDIRCRRADTIITIHAQRIPEAHRSPGRRMLDPRRPTKLSHFKEALDVFGKRLIVSVEEAA